MAKSIKVNFIFNMLNTVSSLVFPLVAFSYASRIIMATGIGEVQFFQSIINYIILLTSIGIPMYGIREIARVRDNKEKLTLTTIEIIFLNLLLNIVGYIIVGVLCFSVAKIQHNIPLFIMMSSSIVLTTIGCSWFFNGIEDFKYITVVGLAIKSLCLLLLFLLVKSETDLFYYGIYTVLGYVGCNLVNFFRLRKYLIIERFSYKDLNIKRHIRPALSVFVFNIVTSIYINLDTVMLGFLSSSASVGYYTAASKVSHILVTIITSFGAVILPRSSNLIEKGKMSEFAVLTEKSFNVLSLLAFPLCVGVFVCTPYLIEVFCGPNFSPAIITLQIVSPIIIALGFSNLIGIQILYPLGKVKLVTISACVGASINVILNFILIPLYSQNGAAIATLVAEWSVLITQFFLARSVLPFRIFDIKILKYFSCAIIMFVICYLCQDMFDSGLINIIMLSIIGILSYTSMMFLTKDSLSLELFNILKKQIIH